MDASSESDASSLPASPWEDDPGFLSRSLYDTPSDTDTSRDEEEDPVCYFYLAPRGALTRGVGAAREPPGRERPTHLAVRVNPETGRPFAPAGEDDSSTLERCATNHATRCRGDAVSKTVVCVERRHFGYAPPSVHEPLSLQVLAARTLGATLRSHHVPRLPPVGSLRDGLLDEMVDFAAPDARILAMAFAAGVTRLHLKDFESILDDAHINVAAWRCWHSEAWRTEAPPDLPPSPNENENENETYTSYDERNPTARSSPPRRRDDTKRRDPPRSSRATRVPPCFVSLDREGVPRRVRDPKIWLKVFEHAHTLRSFAVESGATGEGPITEQCLRVVFDGLVVAGNVCELSVAYFDCVDDGTMAKIWPPCVQIRDDTSEGFVRARRFESYSRVVEPPPLRQVGNSCGLQRLTSLRLSHLPAITDATVLAALDRCFTLTKLKLEFLSVTDACLGAARPGGWRDALKRLQWLEVKACPYVRFAHPGVDFKKPPRKLRTLRIQPGGKPRRGAFFSPEGVNENENAFFFRKPKGGRADMCVSSRHVTQLALSRDSKITRLCLGAAFKGVEREVKKLGLKGNSGGYRADDLLDLRALHFPGVSVLEIFRNSTQVIWPITFGGFNNPWSKSLVDLTVETPSDSLGERLVGCFSLKRLRVCDFSGASVHEFRSFAKMGVLGEKSGRVRLERFIGGGVREDLEPFVADIIQAFAPELQDAHFHREPEYPSD